MMHHQYHKNSNSNSNNHSHSHDQNTNPNQTQKQKISRKNKSFGFHSSQGSLKVISGDMEDVSDACDSDFNLGEQQPLSPNSLRPIQLTGIAITSNNNSNNHNSNSNSYHHSQSQSQGSQSQSQLSEDEMELSATEIESIQAALADDIPGNAPKLANYGSDTSVNSPTPSTPDLGGNGTPYYKNPGESYIFPTDENEMKQAHDQEQQRNRNDSSATQIVAELKLN
jgi:hypothetical protein